MSGRTAAVAAASAAALCVGVAFAVRGPSADGQVTPQPVLSYGDGPALASVTSESGARAAAVRFVRLTEVVVGAAPSVVAEAQRAISTAADGDRLAGEQRAAAEALTARHPVGTVSVRVAPLAVRSEAVGERWLVDVWYVQVVTYGEEAVVEEWRTDTLVLAWERGAWRVADQRSTEGPSPARPAVVVVTSPAGLRAALEGFSTEGLS